MIGYIYQKTFGVLAKRPVRLWGVSLLCVFLTAAAWCGFVLLPPAAFVIVIALETGMAMIYLNCYRTGLEPRTTYLFSAFTGERFWHVVGGMAWMYLWIFLWSLIPVAGIVFGMIRAYEYRFTPYILMTRPDIKPTEAIEISKKETMGYKSTMFWADFLVYIIICAAAAILALLAKIPFVGVLFTVLLWIVYIVCGLFSPLFYGVMGAAFYVEIKSGSLEARRYIPPAPAPAAQYAPPAPGGAPAAPADQPSAAPEPAAEAPAAPETPAPEPAAPEAPETPEPPAAEAPAPETPETEAAEAPAPETPAAPSEPQTPPAQFCTSCGAKLEPGARFCTVCGAKQE
jgi:hypothetical protein